MARDNVYIQLMFYVSPGYYSITEFRCMPVALRQPMWLRIASRQGLDGCGGEREVPF